MAWSAALNVAIGLVLVYLVFSVAASRINEFVASRLQWRADGLERALYTMLGGPKPPLKSVAMPLDGQPVDPRTVPTPPQTRFTLSAEAVKNHPTVAAMEAAVGKARRISYLPSRAFSAAVLDILVSSSSTRSPTRFPRRHNQRSTICAHIRTPTTSSGSPNPCPRTAASQPSCRRSQRPSRTTPSNSCNRRYWLCLPTVPPGGRCCGWPRTQAQAATRSASSSSIGTTTRCLGSPAGTNAQSSGGSSPSPAEQAAVAQAATNAVGKTLDDVDTSVAAINNLALPVGWTPPHEGTDVSKDPRHVPVSLGGWLLKLLGWLGVQVF